jgi:putative SOS response-associated peptidase YedK
MKYRRCLVPADAFLPMAETRQDVRHRNEKWHALCVRWTLGEMEGSGCGTELLTFTVITRDPDELIQSLHDRMPVIIPERDYNRWLQPGDPARPTSRSAASL